MSLAIVVALALISGLCTEGLSSVGDPLQANVEAVLARAQSTERSQTMPGGMNFIEDGGPPSPVAHGVALGLRGIVIGGIPGALTAIVLVARMRRVGRCWSADWAVPLQAGIIFQTCNLILMVPLVLTVLPDLHPSTVGRGIETGFVLLTAALSAIGVSKWRTLCDHIIYERPPSILAF